MTTSLVVQTSFLGDMVLTTPLLAYLAERGSVDVVCTPAAGVLLANNPGVREVIVYDKRGRDRGVGGFVRLARRLRRTGYSSAYLAQGSSRSGALALAAGIRERVGFATSAGRVFYTRRILPVDGMHHAARLLALGTGEAAAPVSRTALRPRLYPGDAERRAVDELLGDARDAVLVAMAPGSVWATKRWPYYAPLAARLPGVRPVVVGGAADAPLAAEIVAASRGRAIDATGKLSLLASAELIGRMRAIVTNDSSPLHLASAMNVPTVAIFGPTVPEFGFGPLADDSVVVERAGLACRPCSRHGQMRCPLGHWRCMREITADAVAQRVLELLSSRTM